MDQLPAWKMSAPDPSTSVFAGIWPGNNGAPPFEGGVAAGRGGCSRRIQPAVTPRPYAHGYAYATRPPARGHGRVLLAGVDSRRRTGVRRHDGSGSPPFQGGGDPKGGVVLRNRSPWRLTLDYRLNPARSQPAPACGHPALRGRGAWRKPNRTASRQEVPYG